MYGTDAHTSVARGTLSPTSHQESGRRRIRRRRAPIPRLRMENTISCESRQTRCNPFRADSFRQRRQDTRPRQTTGLRRRMMQSLYLRDGTGRLHLPALHHDHVMMSMMHRYSLRDIVHRQSAHRSKNGQNQSRLHKQARQHPSPMSPAPALHAALLPKSLSTTLNGERQDRHSHLLYCRRVPAPMPNIVSCRRSNASCNESCARCPLLPTTVTVAVMPAAIVTLSGT